MPQKLQDQIESLIAASGATAMGVAIKHVESGEECYCNADQLFPSGSVFKIPVMCEVFRQVQAGHFKLDDRWKLTTARKNLPSGVLVCLQDGLRPTVHDLMMLMIIISDNTATDMIMHKLGPDATTQFMHQLGLFDIHVPLTIRKIFVDILGQSGADPQRAFVTPTSAPHDDPVNRHGLAYSASASNNVCSARHINQLLEMIFLGQVVDRAACDQMLHILLQQQLNQRLPRYLPQGTPVAHKTGTLAGLRNDSGIIYCNEHSHVAVSVFSTWDAEATQGDPYIEWERITCIDHAIGQIGRAVFDRYAR